jgi:hypothetical protein
MPTKKVTRPAPKPTKPGPKKPATKPTIRRPAPVKKPVKRPAVAAKPKVPTVTPLPPPPQTHASPLPPHVVAAMEAAKAAAQAAPTMTPAQKMWEEIKNLPIQMFGLPGQTVAMHATPVAIEPSRLYLTIRSSATLPSLEEAIKGRYNVELVDKFVVVTPVPAPLVPHK